MLRNPESVGKLEGFFQCLCGMRTPANAAHKKKILNRIPKVKGRNRERKAKGSKLN